jgi:hypothetical protein
MNFTRRTSTRLRISFLALAISCPALAQPPIPAAVEQALATVRPQAIAAHMRFLADDLLEGRRVATRGHDIAAKYVAVQFEALGLQPAGTGGGYFQVVPLRRLTKDESACSVAISRAGRTTNLTYGTDFLAGFRGENQEVTAPVAFVGFGVTAPELGYDDYAGIDVHGKIVALLAGAPATFPHDQRAYYSSPWNRFKSAAAHGAVGVLAIFPPEMEKMFPWELATRQDRISTLTWVDESGRPHRALPEIRGIGALSRKGAEQLFEGAPKSLEEVFKTAENGKPQSFDLPVQASLRTAGRFESTESPNVAAVLVGSDPRLRDEYVVLSAHLDHLGIGEPIAGDAIYNGAYDNASGIAIMLEVANAFTHLPSPPKRSILFLATTGEEAGLQGSDFFANHPTVPIDRIVADVNLDMFLMLHPLRDVIAFGAEHSSLLRTVEEATGRLGIAITPDPFPEQVMFIRSDHYSFVQQGVPAISLSGGFQTSDPAVDGQAQWAKWTQERYHHPSDDMNQEMDFQAGARFAQLNFLITYSLAEDDHPPVWNPGDFFGDTFRRNPPAPARSE